jgi:hypothetical protein
MVTVVNQTGMQLCFDAPPAGHPEGSQVSTGDEMQLIGPESDHVYEQAQRHEDVFDVD